MLLLVTLYAIIDLFHYVNYDFFAQEKKFQPEILLPVSNLSNISATV